MSAQDFLVIWACTFAVMLACRIIPAFALRGRPLPPRVVEGLNLIPPAAFAALVTNDLFTPGMFDAGIWPGAAPIAAAGIVVLVAWKTRSMLWCCIAGVVSYVLLALV